MSGPTYIVAVGKFWIATAQPAPCTEVIWSRPVKAGRVQPALSWEAPDVLVLVGPTFLKSFGSELADRLGRWPFFCHESEWNVGCGNWECFTPRESRPAWPKGQTFPFDAPAIFA